jgi:hypothetical protein
MEEVKNIHCEMDKIKQEYASKITPNIRRTKMGIIADLKEEIADTQKMIDDIQEACSHPEKAVTRVAGSNAGSGQYEEKYWYDCECGLCEKKWTEDQ